MQGMKNCSYLFFVFLKFSLHSIFIKLSWKYQIFLWTPKNTIPCLIVSHTKASAIQFYWIPYLLSFSITYTHLLRRYGIVDNRFCFEGGSSSGKCEGFVVLISDFTEEISNCFKLASQGKLSSNNRYSRTLDGSPRRLKDTQSLKCDCSSSSIFWPSQESRGLDSYVSCDSSSLNDEIDSSDELSHLSR
jgi:hypothetical protein